jgi:hypothetical protein
VSPPTAEVPTARRRRVWHDLLRPQAAVRTSWTWEPRPLPDARRCPGRRSTWNPSEADAQMTALHPVGRVSTPAEVAEVVALPLSPAPGSVNGAVLPLDGGCAAPGADPEGEVLGHDGLTEVATVRQRRLRGARPHRRPPRRRGDRWSVDPSTGGPGPHDVRGVLPTRSTTARASRALSPRARRRPDLLCGRGGAPLRVVEDGASMSAHLHVRPLDAGGPDGSPQPRVCLPFSRVA